MFAQTSSQAVELKQLGEQGILLDKGWKYHPGDNPDWAKLEYDDSKWKSINPTLDIHDLFPQIPRSGIGWFRLHLLVDSTLNNQLAMMIYQSGASEIYLNGKLIHRFGVISSNPEQVKAYKPTGKSVSFPVTKARRQILAIRYALQPHISYSAHWGWENLALFVVVNTVENAFDQYEKISAFDININVVFITLYAILGILYLAFYVSNPPQKVNLYFSLYALMQAVYWSFILYLKKQPFLEQIFIINNFLLVLMMVGYSFLLTAIYDLLEQKRGWIYYFILAVGVISISCGALIYGWGWMVFGFGFTNLINIDITRVALKAIRNNKKGAWIIATGGISFLTFWLLVTSQIFDSSLSTIFFPLAIFSIPITVSIYLGYDFALTHRSLKQNLAEVETLSAEKQQILTSQNETLERQVAQRTSELQNFLKELREAQSQLIQREKMASLGELTAGIAHEIQNPLNFVTNFSGVSVELIEELQQGLAAGEVAEATGLLIDIKQNLEKIILHGQRADSIVKGMLQHSRASTGQKELTDINALAEEYLRLAYHGLRAKDKDFHVNIITELDSTVGKLEVVPQELGRVLLNLLNNAFYATQQKKAQLNGQYQPEVRVSTRYQDKKVEIKVRDNGTGMPEIVKKKIFQPFFTTKPTGQGTGLGLSLSYDIITKGHQGELRVESQEEQFAEFTILLPV
ncbi:GHKL domain-containing protein [Adhaeribacter radiodurans]|uniref:histidine kinase n=2 Tax=Adhaeribacter radiodurans TaxID=2745197 RepID=A0A7L7LG09_9BACT|nr:GHKL domain-containing protein [Adhaeribacter radiodurans]